MDLVIHAYQSFNRTTRACVLNKIESVYGLVHKEIEVPIDLKGFKKNDKLFSVVAFSVCCLLDDARGNLARSFSITYVTFFVSLLPVVPNQT